LDSYNLYHHCWNLYNSHR